ncbi:hypothetical protein CTI14_64300 [Methylobacterium radiotolerans]|nr:hypothetical protein CTI14_64300 [Methylobacterium radiotolerans]
MQAARQARAIHDRDEAVALKNTLEGTKVRLAVKAGKEGRLFGSVKTADVAEAVTAAGRSRPRVRHARSTTATRLWP